MAKVDILLPYWGEFRLLQEAVESVFNQTEQDWRLLVFDDAYPSLEAQEYFIQLHDPRVQYHRHKKNIGITKNFNHALSKATAEYCVMFGCDDRMLPNYIEMALRNIGNADFYQPQVQVIDGRGKVYLPLGDRVKRLLRPKRSGVYSGEKLATSLCHGNWLYFPSIMWKTSIIQSYGFDEDHTITEDVILELSIIADGGQLMLDNEKTFLYRRFAESLSSKEKKKGGVRFNEEAATYSHFSAVFKNLGWKRSAFAASVRFTSRVNNILR